MSRTHRFEIEHFARSPRRPDAFDMEREPWWDEDPYDDGDLDGSTEEGDDTEESALGDLVWIERDDHGRADSEPRVRH